MQSYFLVTELKTMANLVRQMAEQCPAVLQTNGLTAIQCMIIGYLSEHPSRDIFQRDIEAEFMIRRSTVTGILQGMERRGLILRQSVEQDARLKKLVLTETGAEVHRKVWQNLRKIEERALEGICEEDFLIFAGLWKK